MTKNTQDQELDIEFPTVQLKARTDPITQNWDFPDQSDLFANRNIVAEEESYIIFPELDRILALSLPDYRRFTVTISSSAWILNPA